MLLDNVNCASCEFLCSNIGNYSAADRDYLNRNKRMIQYKKGETIFKQFTFVSHIVFVRRGLVKLYIEGRENKNLIIRFILSNQFTGLSALHGENLHLFSAVAQKNTELCLIEKKAFMQLIKTNSFLNKKVLDWYVKAYRTLFLRTLVTGTYNSEARLADTILYLTSQELLSENIFSHITRNDIAEMAGLSNESTMRLLNNFKEKQWIATNRKKIEVLNAAELENISQIR